MNSQRFPSKLTVQGASMGAYDTDLDVDALIEADFAHFPTHFQLILQLKASGYGVTEIARMLRTYRNAIYRVIRKAQNHLSQRPY